jgi:hypothetical protein
MPLWYAKNIAGPHFKVLMYFMSVHIWFDLYCVQVILPTVKNLFTLKSSQAISHIMIEGKAKVLETCSVCIMKADPASDCTVTHHKRMR